MLLSRTIRLNKYGKKVNDVVNLTDVLWILSVRNYV